MSWLFCRSSCINAVSEPISGGSDGELVAAEKKPLQRGKRTNLRRQRRELVVAESKSCSDAVSEPISGGKRREPVVW